MSRLALALAVAAVAACGTSSSPRPGDPPAPPGGAGDGAGTAAAADHGTVKTYRFESAALGVEKNLIVWLPAAYDTSGKRYPVIYLLHPLGGNESNYTKHAGLAETADALGLEAIIVMPDGDAHFYVNAQTPTDYDACMTERKGIYGPQAPEGFCVKAPRYEDYMTRDLVAIVDATLRTIPERGARGLAGFSMGGFGALVLGMRHPDLYAAVASHAGVDALLYAGPWPYDAKTAKLTDDVANWGQSAGRMGAWIRGVFGADLATWRAHDPAVLAADLKDGALAIYLDVGDKDDFGLDAGAHFLHAVLDKGGVKHQFTVVPDGRHDMAFVRGRLDDSLAFLAANLEKAR